MAKEIIGFINKNNEIFNLRDDSSASKYCCKVGKGHENKIAVFTEDGNLKDSNKTIDDLVTKIYPSANDNLVSLDENGNLQDSGKKSLDFASVNHSHSTIIDTNTESNIVIDNGRIYIAVEGKNSGGETEINENNISNLIRALENPAVPASDGNKLITNGQVWAALAEKADAVHTHSGIEEVIENTQSAKLYADNQVQGEPTIIIELTDNNNPGSPVTKSANIDIDNIDNLNRALTTPSSIPENDATKLITSKAIYNALLGKMDNLRSMRITYDHIEDKFIVSESDKSVLVTFRNSAPADTFVPVLVSLYDGTTKDSDVFGLAKWSEEQQPFAMRINILVVIGNYYFFADGDYQEIEDIRFAYWTRTPKGQSFFS